MNSAARVALQAAVPVAGLPTEDEFSHWVNTTLAHAGFSAAEAPCVTIRIVDQAESSALNAGFRGIDKPTNVLAFPAGDMPVAGLHSAEIELGDLVVCLAVVEREAGEQGKSLHDHIAHMAVHGSLHLIGYDHQDDAEADRMEKLETGVMRELGFSDPYQ